MLSVLRGVRSLLSVLLVGLLFMLMSLPLRLVVVPGSFLFPSQRFRLVSLFMKTIVHGIWTALRLGGARARRVGRIPTDEPVLVVANHQSLTDILQLTLLATPFTPAFVTRRRYQRYVPLVSASMRLLGCPIVDPRRDPHGSVAAIRRGARELLIHLSETVRERARDLAAERLETLHLRDLRFEVDLAALDGELRLADLGLALLDGGARRARIESHEELIALHLVAFLHQDFRHATRDLGRHGDQAFISQ